jgi:hypothetical protein
VAQSATNLPAITVSPSRPCGCATGTWKCNSACSDGVWSQPYDRCHDLNVLYGGVQLAWRILLLKL